MFRVEKYKQVPYAYNILYYIIYLYRNSLIYIIIYIGTSIYVTIKHNNLIFMRVYGN